ncbi:DUF3426 domain-containing protein [Acinetobacter sp. CAAS 2-6]|uniref:DUF3426 domain-containing protein n=1 Tax=Acinetobacter sp. CAAS 2-6 TaxID=3016358 RepID=UPI002DD6A7FD|nr:DUF3426 domain-containing protein [Acinetobacter sp. CAAS 2-6]
MSDKQTRCPKCSTVYNVTLTQLTAAQGMVCCPKCSQNFNALTHLVQHDTAEILASNTPVAAALAGFNTNPSQSRLLDIFNRKIENSNIDLQTYLNNLNYFTSEPLSTFSGLNLSNTERVISHEQDKPRGWGYYVLWGSVNIVLLFVLMFQVLWFNPKLLNNSPMLSSLFSPVCQALKCNTLQQEYNLIAINKLKVKRTGKDKTQFSGVLLNQHESSLLLPNVKITLHADGEEVAIYTLNSREYLIKSLQGIQRIPHDRPFKFEFTLPVERKSFDNYSLEIVAP